MHPLKIHRKPVNVLLSEGEYNMLAAIKEDGGISASLVIRQCIISRYNHLKHAKYSCADGARCLCPNLHV